MPLSLFRRPRSIRAKATISLLIIAALGLGATVTAHRAIRRLETKITIIESFYELNQKILETRRYEKNFLLYGSLKDLREALTYLGTIREAIGPVAAFLATTGKAIPLGHETELAEYQDLLQQISVISAAEVPEEQMAHLKEALRSSGQALTAKILDMDATARAQVEREARGYYLMSLAGIGINALASLALAMLLVRWITRPLTAIREGAAKIGGGELTAIPIAPPISDSEEGEELAHTLNQMLGALAAKQEQLIQSAKLGSSAGSLLGSPTRSITR